MESFPFMFHKDAQLCEPSLPRHLPDLVPDEMWALHVPQMRSHLYNVQAPTPATLPNRGTPPGV